MNFILIFSLILLLVLSSQYKITASKLISLGAIFFLLCIVANRNLSVPDTDAYIDIFDLVDSSFAIFSIYPEIGFQYLIKCSKLSCGDNPVALFLWVCILNCILIYWCVYNYNKIHKQGSILNLWQDFILLFSLYFAFFGLYYNAIVLRAGISISLIINAVIFSSKPLKTTADYIKILLLIIISMSFHTSAVVGVILCLISAYYNKPSKSINYLLIGGAVIAYASGIGRYFASNIAGAVLTKFSVLNTDVLNTERFNAYIGEGLASGGGLSFKFLFFTLSALLFNRYNKDDVFYDKSLIILIIGLWIYALFGSILIIERISDFFIIYSAFLYYIYLKNFRISHNNRYSKLILLMSVITLQLLFVMRIINR